MTIYYHDKELDEEAILILAKRNRGFLKPEEEQRLHERIDELLLRRPPEQKEV